MRLHAEAIHGIRAAVLWVIRVTAVLLIGFGGFGLLRWFVYGVLWDVGALLNDAHRGIPLLVIGAALCLFGRRLARWIVSVPDTGCPACGYSTLAGVCPECAYRFGPATGAIEA